MKKFITFIFFFTRLIIGNEPIYISLGSSCEPALHLNACNLRLSSYPFDWLVSSFDSLYTALDDDFHAFLTQTTPLPTGSGIQDFYGLHFIHDFRIPSHPEIDLSEILIKYKRRIARFQ